MKDRIWDVRYKLVTKDDVRASSGDYVFACDFRQAVKIAEIEMEERAKKEGWLSWDIVGIYVRG